MARQDTREPDARARAGSPSRSDLNQRFACLRRLSAVVTDASFRSVPDVRLLQAGRRFEPRIEPGWVGGDSLAADRRRPSARWRSVCATARGAVNRQAASCGTCPTQPTPRIVTTWLLARIPFIHAWLGSCSVAGHPVLVRLTRKMANRVNGLDVSHVQVGEVINLSDQAATMLIAEEWAGTRKRSRVEVQAPRCPHC